MTKPRRRFSPEEKVRILRRHLLDKVPVSDLCDELGLTRISHNAHENQAQNDG